MALCTKCGAKLVDGSHFCVSCGHPIDETPVADVSDPGSDGATADSDPGTGPPATGASELPEDTPIDPVPMAPPAPATAAVSRSNRPESADTHRGGMRMAWVLVIIVALMGLVGVAAWQLWPTGSEPPPSAEPSGPPPPTEPSVKIGPVTVTDSDQPDTVFEFRAEAEVPKPPKTLRCQVSHTTTVLTAAGTMAEEPRSEVDFTLTVATRALRLMEGLFPDPGVQIVCSADGVVTSQTIDRKTGEVITPSPSSTTKQLPAADPPDAPAVQINIEDFNVSPKSSNVDFVVTVEGAAAGATLKCVVTNLEPRDLAAESVTLLGGAEEHRFEFDLTKKYKLLEKSGWILFRCDAESGTAFETVARPQG